MLGIQVICRWGETPIAIRVLGPDTALGLSTLERDASGQGRRDEREAGYLVVPELPAGGPSATFVRVEPNGAVVVELPAGAVGRRLSLGGSNADASRPARTPPWARRTWPVQGPARLVLAPTEVGHVTLGALCFELERVACAPERSTRRRPAWAASAALGHVIGSAVLHAAMLVALAWLGPLSFASSDPMPDETQAALIKHYLNSAERAESDAEPGTPLLLAPAGSEGEPSAERALGPAGQAGTPDHAPSDRRAAIRWRGQDTAPRLPARANRGEAEQAASEFGMIGLLRTVPDRHEGEPRSVWGEAQAQGSDLSSAEGNLWGEHAGASYGVGGLELSGTGLGGGGRGEGVGLGGIDRLSSGALGGRGRLGRSHRRGPSYGCGGSYEYFDSFGQAKARAAHVPDPEVVCAERDAEDPSGCRSWQVRTAPGCGTSVSGRLPPETILAILRQNHGRFRLCYERGLARNPNLAGRVTLRLVISHSGEVRSANAEGPMPDEVTSCLASAAAALQFPDSGYGVIHVSYPLLLQPEP